MVNSFFNKDTMTIVKHLPSQKSCWDKWILIYKRMKLDFYFTKYLKTNSKQIKDLNLTAETIKSLEENKDVNLRGNTKV